MLSILGKPEWSGGGEIGDEQSTAQFFDKLKFGLTL